MPTTTIHVRVDVETKQKAAKALSAMGFSVSDAVRMFLVHVAAFDVKRPNATTVKAMKSMDNGKARRFTSASALFNHLGI